MNRLCIFSIFVLISIAVASWDGPVETVQKEESITSHNTDNDLPDGSNEIGQNRIDAVSITRVPDLTTSETPSGVPSIFTLSPLMLAVALLF
ncbi:hypothetical protein FO519_005342 [Halicephalobus sp. NKZ332]|nr:hypothetical protein FO519_005342 [Halicephalobus sp. NKZ332]